MLAGEMLRRSAERFPAKPAIVAQGGALSYAALDQSANRLANALIAGGVKKGEKLAILCRNLPEYGMVFFGVARSGAVLVNVSTLYPAAELAYVLGKADVTTLFYDAAFADKVEAVRAELPLLKRFVCIGEGGRDAGLGAFMRDADSSPPAVPISAEDPFCMTYTGGTTGRPKGVLCSHLNRYITAHTVAVEEALDERDIVGIVTPMFHVAALNIMFQPAVLVGATCAFLAKWSVDGFARMVRDTGMTAAFMVPTQVSMVLSDPGFDPAEYASWRKLSFAGAPMPDWVQRELLQRLPLVAMTQIYGQSEMGVLTSLKPWHLPRKLGSIGRQAYNVDVALVDTAGHAVAAGSVGEIASRGNNVMLEYYNEPAQTSAIMRNGWALTGDLGIMDDEGFITLVDRAKDMMISGGENIYPKEIEDALYELPAVAECAVFGVPHDKWGEVPIAYILLHRGCSLTETEVIAYCEQRLARFKRPRSVRFVDDFPKTPIGKIQKNLLREKHWTGREKKI